MPQQDYRHNTSNLAKKIALDLNRIHVILSNIIGEMDDVGVYGNIFFPIEFQGETAAAGLPSWRNKMATLSPFSIDRDAMVYFDQPALKCRVQCTWSWQRILLLIESGESDDTREFIEPEVEAERWLIQRRTKKMS